ncbi:ABC transporter ATP-binding protein [Elusimicrobiota bacterium]
MSTSRTHKHCALELKNLSKTYHIPRFLSPLKVKALENLSLCINEGEIFGLLGPNGSGKTTTLRILLGLIRPDSGSVHVFGQSFGSNLLIRSELGYLPENVAFPPSLTAIEVLKFLGKLDPNKFKNNKFLTSRIKESLEIVGLKRFSDRRISSFSKGMNQRLGIAQALMHKPRLLVLDEPASGLDPLGIVNMRELFAHVNKELGITILFSSHVIGEVEKVSNRVAIMIHGKLLKTVERDTWEKDHKKTLESIFLEIVSPLIKEA